VAGGGDGLVLVVSSGGYRLHTHTSSFDEKYPSFGLSGKRERPTHTHTHRRARRRGRRITERVLSLYSR
jgi:hypothetical protein